MSDIPILKGNIPSSIAGGRMVIHDNVFRSPKSKRRVAFHWLGGEISALPKWEIEGSRFAALEANRLTYFEFTFEVVGYYPDEECYAVRLLTAPHVVRVTYNDDTVYVQRRGTYRGVGIANSHKRERDGRAHP